MMTDMEFISTLPSFLFLPPLPPFLLSPSSSVMRELQVRSCTKSLVVDMGFVLEGTEAWELPECLLGVMRLHHLDLSHLKTLDMSQELPLIIKTG